MKHWQSGMDVDGISGHVHGLVVCSLEVCCFVSIVKPMVESQSKKGETS